MIYKSHKKIGNEMEVKVIGKFTTEMCINICTFAESLLKEKKELPIMTSKDLKKEVTKIQEEHRQKGHPDFTTFTGRQTDPVNPLYYDGDLVARICEHFNLDAWCTQVIKYVLRHRNKNDVEDLKKGAWYLAREIELKSGAIFSLNDWINSGREGETSKPVVLGEVISDTINGEDATKVTTERRREMVDEDRCSSMPATYDFGIIRFDGLTHGEFLELSVLTQLVILKDIHDDPNCSPKQKAFYEQEKPRTWENARYEVQTT